MCVDVCKQQTILSMQFWPANATSTSNHAIVRPCCVHASLHNTAQSSSEVAYSIAESRSMCQKSNCFIIGKDNHKMLCFYSHHHHLKRELQEMHCYNEKQCSVSVIRLLLVCDLTCKWEQNSVWHQLCLLWRDVGFHDLAKYPMVSVISPYCKWQLCPNDFGFLLLPKRNIPHKVHHHLHFWNCIDSLHRVKLDP